MVESVVEVMETPLKEANMKKIKITADGKCIKGVPTILKIKEDEWRIAVDSIIRIEKDIANINARMNQLWKTYQVLNVSRVYEPNL